MEGREVYFRIADLPKGWLDALRTRDTRAIVVCVAYLLFIDRLRRTIKGHRIPPRGLFAEWIEFVEDYPFARGLKPTQMGLCGDNPPQLAPLEPNDLPAAPIDRIEVGPDTRTLWYAIDHMAFSAMLDLAKKYRHVIEQVPRLRNENEALRFAEERLKEATPHWLMGFRDITNSTNERTVMGGVFPRSAVGNNLPVWKASAGTPTVLPALLSSLACDYSARLKVGGTHLNFFIAKQIAVLPPEVFDQQSPWGCFGESVYKWVLPRALELTYTAWDLEPFAHDCGWTGFPFRLDDDRRFLLRCELDAAFFHLYVPSEAWGDWQPPRQIAINHQVETPEQLAELTRHFPTPRDAVDYIMDTFPIVRRKDEAQHGEFRTKRVTLDIYDAMQTAVATGEPYRTVLDPPPADRSCCHRSATSVPDLASVTDGEWVIPQGDKTGAETAILAAVLKSIGGPAPRRTVRLAALLAMEPKLLVPSLSPEEATHWQRAVGDEAMALDSRTVLFQTSANHSWGRAVRQLRGAGRLIEDLMMGTWAPGPGLDAIYTVGWPEGRVGVVLHSLDRSDSDKIVRTLPDGMRDWINADAA